MAKRVQVHIPYRVWQKLMDIAQQEGRQTKRMTRKIMVRALWDFVQREDPETKEKPQ